MKKARGYQATLTRHILAASLSILPASGMALDTILSYYRPFLTAKPVVPLVAGSCMASSSLITREDAWRCQVEGKTYDPCFVSYQPNRKMAYCPQSPLSKEGVWLELATDLTPHLQSIDMSRGYPWIIALDHDIECQAIETTETLQGLPIRYHCKDGSRLFGHIQRCTPEWHMLREKAQAVDLATLVKVWF